MPDIEPAKQTDTEVSQEDQAKSTRTDVHEKRPLSIWRRMFRILLGILIIFGLGSILVIFTLYIPLRQQFFQSQERIKELTTQSDTQLNSANEEIVRLTTVEDKYNAAQAELTSLTTQNLITRIQLDATTAKLALVSDKADEASQALTQTLGRIEELQKLLPDEQQKDIDNLQKRLELVNGEIQEDKFAAVSDLDVMLAILSNLEQKPNP